MKKIWLYNLSKPLTTHLRLLVFSCLLFSFFLFGNSVKAAVEYNSQLLTTDNLVSDGWSNPTGYTFTKSFSFSNCDNPIIIESADVYQSVNYSVYFNDVQFSNIATSNFFDAYNERKFHINYIIPNSNTGTLKIVYNSSSNHVQHQFQVFCNVDSENPILENSFVYQTGGSGWTTGTYYYYENTDADNLHLAMSFSRYYNSYQGSSFVYNPVVDFTEIFNYGRGNVLRFVASYSSGISEFVYPTQNNSTPDTANLYLTLKFSKKGLSIETQNFNAITGQLTLTGTCKQYGSGINQMSIYTATSLENAIAGIKDANNILRGGLVDCINDEYIATFDGLGLYGNYTIYIDDTFFGTELASVDQFFYYIVETETPECSTGYRLIYNDLWGGFVCYLETILPDIAQCGENFIPTMTNLGWLCYTKEHLENYGTIINPDSDKNVLGWNTYEMACSNDDWNTPDPVFGIDWLSATTSVPALNFTKHFCKAKKFGLDIVSYPITFIRVEAIKIKNKLGSIFPFNILSGFLNSFKEAEQRVGIFKIKTAYATSTFDFIDMPENNEGFNIKLGKIGDNATMTMKIFNKSEIENTLGTELVGFIRNFFNLALYILFFIYIFQRIKNFDI